MTNSILEADAAPGRSFSTRLEHRLHQEGPLGYLLIGPAFLFLLALIGYPFLYAIYLSVTDKVVGAPANFVGLENFIILSKTALFWKSLKNSIVYTAGALILKFVGGLALALFLNRKFVGERLVKALLLLPWIIPTVFSTLIWWWILDPAYSIVNIILRDLDVITTNLPFLVDPTWAMISLIMVNVWRGVPFFAITFLAGLQTVPEELIDASRIDGANAWQRLRFVIFPLILPVVTIVVLISTIGTISEFELPWLLTGGGPVGATTVYPIMAYNLAMRSGFIARGAAVSLALFPVLALLVVGSLIQLRRND